MNVHDAIYGLRATRVYDGRPVPHDTLATILEAATRACSSGNTQPWEFVVVTDTETKSRLQVKLREAFAVVDAQRAQSPDRLVDRAGRPVTGHAAIENIHNVGALVFVFWNPDRGIRMQGEYEARPDGTLKQTRPIPGGRGSSLFPACQNMMLAAYDEGVASLFTTFFGLIDRDVKALLHVPPRMFLESCSSATPTSRSDAPAASHCTKSRISMIGIVRGRDPQDCLGR
jgi:nitroreductase